MRTVHLLNRNDLMVLRRGTAFDIRCPCGLTHSVQTEHAYGRARTAPPALLALPAHTNGRARPTRRAFTAAFKRRAVERVLRGESVAGVAAELGIARSVIFNWRRTRRAS